MIFLTVSRKTHSRVPEWFSASLLAGFGVALLFPGDTFQGPSYAAFGGAFGEIPSGILITAIGLAWCAGLWWNGRAETVTSTVRAACAFMGVVVYAMLSTGFAISFWRTGILSTGVWTYFMLSMLALYSLTQIVRAKGASENGSSN